ncbi:hypothetical protein EDC94DRAFT_663751 [Helicostylum pulchrum]|nr:hypothetical protein EDC94DRAFT_663751 [Helicostylum pulchrum]
MERQSNADILDRLVYYDRYELGIAEARKEELDITKSLNNGIKMINTMKYMLSNISKHCPSTEIAIEGLKINLPYGQPQRLRLYCYKEE